MKRVTNMFVSWLLYWFFVIGFLCFLLNFMYVQAAIFALGALLASELYVEKTRKDKDREYPA